MPRYRALLILTLSACCCNSCQKEPIDTRAKDERNIRDADAATLKGAQANDVDGAVAHYADDADWLPPNAPIVHGKTAIRAGWAKLIGNPGFTIDWQISKLEVARSGDLHHASNRNGHVHHLQGNLARRPCGQRTGVLARGLQSLSDAADGGPQGGE